MAAPTAKQQMQRGDWYLEDAQLESEIERAHELMDAFNAAPRRSPAAAAALHALLGAVGDHATVRTPFYCDYGTNTRLGDRAYLNFGCVFLDEGAIHVGARVMLGPGVHIYTVTHPADPAERATRVMRALPVVIEDDAWVGGRSVILPGVTIGRGAIVGAGSVVTKDVAPLTVVGGSPAQFIKHVEATSASKTSNK